MNNKYIKILALGFLLMPLSGMAAGGALGNSGPTPVQSYESANLATRTPPPAKPGNSTSTKSAKSVQPATSNYADETLQAELTQINQNNLLFQQKADQRLIQLTNENKQLQQRVKQLTRALLLLNEELVQVKKASGDLRQLKAAPPVRQTASSTLVEWAHILENHFGETGFKVIVSGVGVLLILLIWAIWPRDKEKKEKKHRVDDKINQHATQDDTKDEYDYMGSPESIPAKINLARTYIAMEDYEAARHVLGEVFRHGSEEYKQQAEDLLDELPAES